MPNISAIRAAINNLSVYGTQEQLDAAWLSWFRAVAEDIEPNRLEAICQAERDKQHSISTRRYINGID